MSDLTAFDIFFFAVLGIFALLGLKRGFVTEILTLMAWAGGIIAVNLFFDRGREIALGYFDSDVTASVASVLVLFFGMFILLRIIARMLGNRVKKSVIGPIDRVLGLGFGALKGVLLATLVWMLLVLVFDLLPGQDPDWLNDARSGPVLAMFADEVQDFVEERREGGGPGGGRETGYDEDERDALDAVFEDASETEI